MLTVTDTQTDRQTGSLPMPGELPVHSTGHFCHLLPVGRLSRRLKERALGASAAVPLAGASVVSGRRKCVSLLYAKLLA